MKKAGTTLATNEGAPRRPGASSAPPDLARTLESIRPFTMIPEQSLVDLAHQVRAVLAYGIPGDFVECGVWRGGASFLMADLLRQAGVRDRKVWLFDSFEGLPAPDEVDSASAEAFTRNTDSPDYFDNCRASLEEVKRSAAELGLSAYTEFVKGWFDETLCAERDRIGPIAILRLDCDWHSSVLCCLDSLCDQVVDGGFVILDDYYTWEGCAVAVHEFLARQELPYRIESGAGASAGFGDHHSALFRKGATTWRWLRQVYLATQDVEALVPAKHNFVLVDQEQLGMQVGGQRRAIPFLEKDGDYWGPPEDDDAAIRELERLRRSGASFLVFAWPAFWYFDSYTGLLRHLRSKFHCVLENERVVAFDLRS